MLCELPRVRSQRLFKLVQGHTRTDRDVFALLDDLERRAELFVAAGDPNHGYWADLPAAKPYIRELSLFRVRQMMPLLFTAWESFLSGRLRPGAEDGQRGVIPLYRGQQSESERS